MLLYIYNMLLDAFPLDKDRSRFVSWLVERFVLKFADSSELVPLLRIEEESRTDEREIAVDTSLRIDLFRAQWNPNINIPCRLMKTMNITCREKSRKSNWLIID